MKDNCDAVRMFWLTQVFIHLIADNLVLFCKSNKF